jgi:hypothetical protein
METKQTAMQELIQWLKIGWKDEDVDTVIKKAEQLLEMEKEQIMNAYEYGNCDYEFGIYIKGEQYYNETYGK